MDEAKRALYGKILELQKRVATIGKDAQNDYHHYRYASATKVNEIVKAIANELGLVVLVQTDVKTKLDGSLALTAEGAVVAGATVFVVDAETGASMTISSSGSGSDKADKAVMKANTAATKYGLLALAFAATGDDPEADKTTDIRAEGTKPTPAVSRTNRPAAPSPAPPPQTPAPTPKTVGEGVQMVAVMVDKVFGKRDTGRTNDKGKIYGPGTVVDVHGSKYDTFDTGLLDIAKDAKVKGVPVVIMFTVDERYNRNKIVDQGLGLADADTNDSGDDDPGY